VKTPSGEQIECPSCGSTNLRWSNKPHFMNFFMAFLFRDPIRCCECSFRFYGRALTDVEYEKEQARKSAGHRHAEEEEED
jgi:C4-type Zn-finger protein